MSAFLAAAGPATAQDLPPVDEMLSERVMGEEDAPVTLIEYASLTCPHCATFHTEQFPDIKENYIDTGKVKLVYRDFPLDRLALAASMMARCAPEERYFGIINSLFKGQQSWARDADPTGALANVGRLAGMSRATFDACLQNREVLNGIVAMRSEGEQQYQVNSTPTLIVDGRKVEGGASYERLAEIIDAALAAKQ